MKFVISIFCLLCTLIGATQQIPPGAKTILVKGVTFKEVCSRLLDSNYAIAKKDEELQTVRTEPMVYPRHWNAAYVINIRVKDSTAYITGTFTAPWGQPFTRAAAKTDPLWNGDPIYYHCNKKGKPYPKSLIGYPFLLINKFALSFNKDISYQ